MKRLLLVFLAFGICLTAANCGKTSAPLEITKAWTVEKFESNEPLLILESTPKTEKTSQPLTLTYSKDFNYSVEIPQKNVANRFIAVEIAPKSETELKFKPEEIALTDSGGKRYLPIGFAPFSNMKYLHYFEGFNDGTLKAQSPEGGIAGVGKEQKDSPAMFWVSGKNPKGALIFEVPAESGGFQLTVAGSSPLAVTVQ